MYNRTTGAQSEPSYQVNNRGLYYNLAKFDWAYDGFSKFSDCYNKVLSINPNFKQSDTNGFFTGEAYKFLLELE